MFEFLKKEESGIAAPIGGTCIPLGEVPDDAFASGKMGTGFAVASTGDTVVAPVDGTIVMIPETRHAFGIETKSGEEVLVHIGLNTVRMLGKGFMNLKAQGESVKAGEAVIRFDREIVEEAGKDLTVIVTFPSGKVRMHELTCYGNSVSAGEILK